MALLIIFSFESEEERATVVRSNSPLEAVPHLAASSDHSDSTPVGDPAATPIPPSTGKDCTPKYSTVSCKDDGSNTFVGPASIYGFIVTNRSCMYNDIVFDKALGKFVFYSEKKVTLPRVSLSSRPFDLPAVMAWKRKRVIRRMSWTMDYAPEVRVGPIPCSLERDERSLAYYSPIVAPWNYAHTLFCDLFGLFWAMWEYAAVEFDWQVVAVGRHYKHDFPLPNPKYKAFGLFSRTPPVYEADLPTRVYRRLLCGIGTKSWSWVTTSYRASGNPHLWFAFRRHVINVTGAEDWVDPKLTYEGALQLKPRSADPSRRPRVSICHKKDKRGIANYDETLAFLKAAIPNADFVLEGAVGKDPKAQVQMMIDADIYMCNEGTLGTTFFMMPPGSAFVSLPLAYHTPHLHHRKMPHPSTWWKAPDMMRPDPRKNVGGNIDWFPQAIPWVRTSWYDYVPLNETKIQTPLSGLRNYMPDMNHILQERRLVPLMRRAVEWVTSSAVEESPNYSINANLCRQLLELTPTLTQAFNSARCYYGMSWLCEFWTNTAFKWRIFHEKWRLSKSRCGDNRTSPELMGLVDPREERPMSEFLFYTREELARSYRTVDLGDFSATEEELDKIFGSASKKSDALL